MDQVIQIIKIVQVNELIQVVRVIKLNQVIKVIQVLAVRTDNQDQTLQVIHVMLADHLVLGTYACTPSNSENLIIQGNPRNGG